MLKAIILAAGRGTRINEISSSKPKCLIDIQGTSIIQNAIQALESIGVAEVIIVVGYKREKIIKHVGSNYKGMKIIYVRNLDYDISNTSYSFHLALNELKLDNCNKLILLEGDVIFAPQLLESLLEKPKSNCSIVQSFQPHLDGSFVEIDEGLRIIDWIHITKRTKSFIIQSLYKTVNIHSFQPIFIDKIIKPQVDKMVHQYNKMAPLEYVFQEIVLRTGSPPIYAIEARDKWMEVDTIEDMKLAMDIFGDSTGTF